MTTSKPDTVIGKVVDVSEPKSLTSPAIITITPDDELVGELKFWPKKDYKSNVVVEPVQLGQVWDYLVKQYGDPPDALIGKTIVATAFPKPEREGRAQWSDAKTIKVIDQAIDTQPATPVDTPVSKPSPKPLVVDRQDQIMLQHGTHVSAICYNAWVLLPVDSRGSFSDYLRHVAMGGTWLLENVYQKGGYKAAEQVVLEEESENQIDPATMDEGDPADAVLGTI
jgi:hypothetical protein